MKKLSFIMAVIMIVMTFPMMFMTSASAAAGDNPADGYQITQEDKDSGKLCLIITGEGASAVKTYYDTIPAALKEAEDDGVVYVLKPYVHSGGNANWSLYGKTVTLDFLGNSWTGSSTGNRFANINYEGTTYVGEDKASAIVIKNATIKATGDDTIFQIYNYMSVEFNNCEITLDVTGHLGSSICQSYTTLKFIGCDLRINDALGGADKYNNNTTGMLFRDNGGVGNTFIVEDSYCYTPGILMKQASNTGDKGGKSTWNFKNSTIETGSRGMFVLQSPDITINIDNCNLNSQLNGLHGSDLPGAVIWQHSATNRTKVSITNSNITVGSMRSNQYVFCVDAAAAGTIGNEYKIENTNVTANNGGLFSLGGKGVAADITFNGGVYTATGGRILYASTSADATYNFVDGVYVAYNVKDVDVAPANGEDISKSGMFYLSNCKALNIYGGSYSMFSDHGLTLCTKAPIVFGWSLGGQNTTVCGGKFTGGSCFFAKVKPDSNAKYDEAGSVFYGYAEGKNSINLAPDVTKGASVRLDTKSGLRFTSTIDAKAVEYVGSVLAKADTALTFGTVITRASYLKYTGGEFTMAAFDKAGKNYVNVVAKDGIVKDEKGNVTINAALVDIDADNYTKDFVAISYIKYTNANDEEVYLYATNVTLAEYARNMEEVALAALADVKKKAEGAYTNAVSEYYVYNVAARKYELYTGTVYSAYTAEQVKALQSYIVVEE